MNDQNRAAPSKPSVTAERTAIVILLGFGAILVWLLLGARTEDETQWARLMMLYNGVEAMAFAAAGVLLGSHVQRPRVEAAENRANDLQVEFNDATKRATDAESRGRSLRVAIETVPASGGAFESDSDDVARLVKMARQLFPDREG